MRSRHALAGENSRSRTPRSRLHYGRVAEAARKGLFGLTRMDYLRPTGVGPSSSRERIGSCATMCYRSLSAFVRLGRINRSNRMAFHQVTVFAGSFALCGLAVGLLDRAR